MRVYVSCSFSSNAALALVHAFICSRIDYFNTIHIGLPLGHIGQLKRATRTAATLVGVISKC